MTDPGIAADRRRGRQWTTMSEQIVFRSGATLFLVWMLIATWWMRKGSIHPRPDSVEA